MGQGHPAVWLKLAQSCNADWDSCYLIWSPYAHLCTGMRSASESDDSPCLSRPFLLPITAISPDTFLDYLIPSWHLLLSGPKRTWEPIFRLPASFSSSISGTSFRSHSFLSHSLSCFELPQPWQALICLLSFLLPQRFLHTPDYLVLCLLIWLEFKRTFSIPQMAYLQWCAGKCSTTDTRGKAWICSSCLFPLCKDSCHGQFQNTNTHHWKCS